MSTPNPVPGYSPSNSTTGSAIGAALATLVVYGFHLKGIDFPAGVEAAIGGLISLAAGYLPASGRK